MNFHQDVEFLALLLVIQERKAIFCFYFSVEICEPSSTHYVGLLKDKKLLTLNSQYWQEKKVSKLFRPPISHNKDR